MCLSVEGVLNGSFARFGRRFWQVRARRIILLNCFSGVKSLESWLACKSVYLISLSGRLMSKMLNSQHIISNALNKYSHVPSRSSLINVMLVLGSPSSRVAIK